MPLYTSGTAGPSKSWPNTTSSTSVCEVEVGKLGNLFTPRGLRALRSSVRRAALGAEDGRLVLWTFGLEASSLLPGTRLLGGCLSSAGAHPQAGILARCLASHATHIATEALSWVRRQVLRAFARAVAARGAALPELLPPSPAAPKVRLCPSACSWCNAELAVLRELCSHNSEATETLSGGRAEAASMPLTPSADA